VGEGQTFIVAGGGGSGIAKIIPWRSQWRIKYECSKSILYESRVTVRHKEIYFSLTFLGLC